MKIPTDVKDIKAIREFLTTIRTQVCGMADCLLPGRDPDNGLLLGTR